MVAKACGLRARKDKSWVGREDALRAEYRPTMAKSDTFAPTNRPTLGICALAAAAPISPACSNTLGVLNAAICACKEIAQGVIYIILVHIYKSVCEYIILRWFPIASTYPRAYESTKQHPRARRRADPLEARVGLSHEHATRSRKTRPLRDLHPQW